MVTTQNAMATGKLWTMNMGPIRIVQRPLRYKEPIAYAHLYEASASGNPWRLLRPLRHGTERRDETLVVARGGARQRWNGGPRHRQCGIQAGRGVRGDAVRKSGIEARGREGLLPER